MTTYSAAESPIVGGRFMLPEWRRNMAPQTWAEVGTNTISELDPKDDPLVNPNFPGEAPWRAVSGQSALIASWCGGAWCDIKRRLYMLGGGHNDYAGNELYYWDGNTGEFVRETNPTGAIGNEGVLDDGLDSSAVYFDGQPRSFHTYGNPEVINGVLWSPGGSVYKSGGAASRAFYYDEPSKLWAVDSAVTGLVSYGSTCYDSIRNALFCFGTGTSPVMKYDLTTKQYVAHTNGGWSAGGDNSSVYDPARDCVLVRRNQHAPIRCIDAAGVLPAVDITTTALPAAISVATWGKNEMKYDALRDRFLMWVGGTTIYTLTAPNGDIRASPWVWGQVDAGPTNTITPTDPTQYGTWGRFWFSKKMNCVGVVNATNQKMYVMSLEDS